MNSNYGKARFDGAGIPADLITGALEPTHWKVRWQKRLNAADDKINYNIHFQERLYPKKGTAKGQYTRLRRITSLATIQDTKERIYTPIFVVELIPCTLIEHEPIKDE